jgi:hypothetical protein
MTPEELFQQITFHLRERPDGRQALDASWTLSASLITARGSSWHEQDQKKRALTEQLHRKLCNFRYPCLVEDALHRGFELHSKVRQNVWEVCLSDGRRLAANPKTGMLYQVTGPDQLTALRSLASLIETHGMPDDRDLAPHRF